MRLIFDGLTELTAFEAEGFSKFQKTLKDSGDEDRLKLNEEKEVWSDSNLMRFLQASGWKYNSAIENITKHIEWRKENLPILEDEAIMDFLVKQIDLNLSFKQFLSFSEVRSNLFAWNRQQISSNNSTERLLARFQEIQRASDD